MGCVFRPEKGEEMFRLLKKAFGYPKASYIYNRVMSEEFISKYKDKLDILEDGSPTFDSLMKLSIITDYIGLLQVLDSFNNSQPHLNNTAENTLLLVDRAADFNRKNPSYIAIVEYDDDGKLTISIENRTEKNKELADYQLKILKINQAIAEILTPIGITIGELTSEETSVGRVGVTDFSKALDTVAGLSSIMRVANNMEGLLAISEEFSHFIIGVYRNKPIVNRSILAIITNGLASTILGDEYTLIYDFYNGDLLLIAEEAAGKLLRDHIIGESKPVKGLPILRRMVDFIISLFKGFNSAYLENQVNKIKNDLGSLADDIMESKEKITKQKVLNSHRYAAFNALSEKAEVQVSVLKEILERSYKNAALLLNLPDFIKGETTFRSEARLYADEVSRIIQSNVEDEETMSAIASFIDIAKKNIDLQYERLKNIDSYNEEDKFIILRNTLYTIQSYSKTIDDLYDVTTEEFLRDEGISLLIFLMEDANNSLAEFETDGEIDQINTEGMSGKDIADKIAEEASHFKLSDDETYYIDDRTGQKYMRVTRVIESDEEGTSFDPTNAYVTPSTNIGTGIDELTRDFIGGKLTKVDDKYQINGKNLSEVYPNASESQLLQYIHKLEETVTNLLSKGIQLVPRDIVANGVVQSKDGTGRIHNIKVAGTLDLLGYDAEGNFYIFDMKTHRGTITVEKRSKWERQLTLYKKFLQDTYGISVKSMQVIPIKVSYPKPLGTLGGTTHYTVSPNKPEDYSGKHPNQLLADGEEYKSANPTLESLITINNKDVNISYKKIANDPSNGIGQGRAVTVDLLSKMVKSYKELNSLFSEKARNGFVAFLKPFIGENIKVRDKNGKMLPVSIKKVLLNAEGDSDLLQRWLTSMADNPDALLLIFDKVVKYAKDEHRIKTIETSLKILALGKKYEALGITDYDWMYEADKKNYINPIYNKAAFEKAKAEFYSQLDEKYGKHPTVGSLEYTKKKQEKLLWIKNNTKPIKSEGLEVTFIPKPELYPPKKLSKVQQDFFEEWMSLKEELDTLLGPGKTTLHNTIKIRKSGIERVKGIMSSEAITNFVEETKSKFIRSFDDELNYKTSRSIMGFDNLEIMKLPIYYVNDNGDSSDISTDAIGTLIAYAEMAYNYEAMDKILNPLEIGKFVAVSQRKIRARKGDRSLTEKFNFAGSTRTHDIYVDMDSSKFKLILDDFFESKIFGRYLLDNGKIIGTSIDTNKAVGILLKIGSTILLGFNTMAHFTNATTGAFMANIEAAAGEFFTPKILLAADKAFTKEMGDYMKDVGQRVNNSKLALFDEMFDVRQNFRSKVKEKDFLNKTILGRLFGPRLLYLGQDAGDHWLYNRIAIAVAMTIMLKDKNGNSISLWDALVVKPLDPSHPELGSKLVLEDGITLKDGSEWSSRALSQISGRMRYINQHLYGIYNEEDAIAARRTIVGRLAMQYRDWIPALYRYRFGAMTTNLEKGGDIFFDEVTVEGFYRTTYRFIKGLRKELQNGEKTIGQVWDDLEDFERANIVRALTEVGQFIFMSILAALISGADKDRPWLRRFLSLWSVRSVTELGSLIPGPNAKELINIVKSPAACTNVITDISSLSKLLWIPNWLDNIESGDYKDHSTAYRAFMRSPLTIWYRTIMRNLRPERSEKFFEQ